LQVVLSTGSSPIHEYSKSNQIAEVLREILLYNYKDIILAHTRRLSQLK
jgi:hypothetical protein